MSRAREQAALRDRTRLVNETFLNHRHPGPTPPDPGSRSQAQTFEPSPRSPWLDGPGVRGRAAYLFPSPRLNPFPLQISGVAAWVRPTGLDGPNGYTLSGWVRVRDGTLSVFQWSPTGERPLLELTATRTGVTFNAVQPHPQGPLKLAHLWDGGERWHHVAVVADQRVAVYRLYVDGRRVAERGGKLWPLGPYWPLAVGFASGPGLPPDQLVGAVDECQFIGRPLSDEDIEVLIGRRAPRPEAPAPRPVERP